MKTTPKFLFAFFAAVLICSASTLFAQAQDGDAHAVPESFSTLWLALPVVGMIGLSFLRRKKP
jgi:hypothetical protein